jgi:hypothetical protein
VATKQTLHQLVDELPDGVVDQAERLLRGLQTDDPVLRAALLAPLDDEPETNEERSAVDEARAARAAGRVVSQAEARRRLH